MLQATPSEVVPAPPAQVPRAPRCGREVEDATAQALTHGGDARIELGADGVNCYGCAPRPDPALIALGSSTASVVSRPAFDAAAALHARLQGHPGNGRAEADRLRRQLLTWTGAAGVAGTAAVFAASGTDLHRVAALLARGGDTSALQALLAETSETGSGVATALAAGCAAAAPNRAPVAPSQVRLRNDSGQARPGPEVDADFEARAEGIVRSGRRCLLVLTDLSKTGLLAPSPGCVARLHERLGERLTVLVDACQFRLGAAALQHYLGRGWMVAVTGSKFLTGPAFCGALLLPPAIAARAGGCMLAALAPGSARCDWPAPWTPARQLTHACNGALLLRWQAALVELERFAAVPPQRASQFVHAFGAAVARRIAGDANFRALPVPAIDRPGAGDASSWDRLQTIFPFVVHRRVADGRRIPVDGEVAAWLHLQMQRAHRGGPAAAVLRFQIGQPVPCATRDGVAAAALRISLSARQVADADARGRGPAEAVAHAMAAFDKLAWLAALPLGAGAARAPLPACDTTAARATWVAP